MPIYEYQCAGCGHKLEKLQKISEAPLTDCPDCGAARLQKLVSAAAFRLKGGGWYETDFKQEQSRKNLAKPEQKPASGKPEQKKAGEKKATGKDGKSAGKPADNKSAGDQLSCQT
ncbi:MAG: FmdB family zinc ribbon protein [Gammaproteobacteria bacterium]